MWRIPGTPIWREGNDLMIFIIKLNYGCEVGQRSWLTTGIKVNLKIGCKIVVRHVLKRLRDIEDDSNFPIFEGLSHIFSAIKGSS